MNKKVANTVITLLLLVVCYLSAKGLNYIAESDIALKKAHDQRLIDQGRKECQGEHNYKESDVIYVDGTRYVPAS